MGKKTRIFIAVISIILIVLIYNLVSITNLYKGTGLDGFMDGSKSTAGLMIIFLLYALRPLFIMLPASPMAIAIGAIFGPVKGIIIVVIGALISGTTGFFFARSMGKRFFDRITHHRIIKIKSKIEGGSWASVISLNFCGLGWDIVSIACGLSKIRYLDFLIGISISAVPLNIIAVMLGGIIFSVRSVSDLIMPQNLLILGIVILGLFMPHYIKRRLDKSAKKNV